MQQKVNSRSQIDGQRSYPSLSMEIYLLAHAQQKGVRKEAIVFDQLANSFKWSLLPEQRKRYQNALALGDTLVVTDLSRTILWVSSRFLGMTGYTAIEAVGQTPAFLRGEKTSLAEQLRIRDGLSRLEPVEAELVNYRKNGEAYVCQIHIDPLRTTRGDFTHFLALESEVRR